MSTYAPAEPPKPDPNPNGIGPKKPDHLSSAFDMPTDPLLDSGSFIDADPLATPGRNKGKTIRERQSENPATSNGTECIPTPDSTLKRPPSAAGAWLPPGWAVEDRVRTSGATAGTVDKYYHHIASGRRFRSKKEVLYFLETGTRRKRRKENSDADLDSLGSSGSTKQKKSSTKAKNSALNFDYFHAPESVQWVLTNPSEGSWIPFISNVEVPESVRQDWAAAFTNLTISKGGHKMF